MTGIAKVFGGLVFGKQLETDFSDSFDAFVRFMREREAVKLSRIAEQRAREFEQAFQPGKTVTCDRVFPGCRSLDLAVRLAEKRRSMDEGALARILVEAMAADKSSIPLETGDLRELHLAASPEMVREMRAQELSSQRDYVVFLQQAEERGEVEMLPAGTRLRVKAVARDGDERQKVLKCEFEDGPRAGEVVFCLRGLLCPLKE